MKKITIIASALLLTDIFSECASSSAPTTPQEYRKETANSMMGTKIALSRILAFLLVLTNVKSISYYLHTTLRKQRQKALR